MIYIILEGDCSQNISFKSFKQIISKIIIHSQFTLSNLSSIKDNEQAKTSAFSLLIAAIILLAEVA
jgi:hypothetical protein